MSVVALGFALQLIAGFAFAKSGGDDQRREVYGLIDSRPETGLVGAWVIGGQTFKADSRTEFDEKEGPLQVGNCAKVDIRNGHVHEIDSEPMSDCR